MEHELEPPAWVVSSGRPFRFRCSSCGFSQMVQPAVAPVAAVADAPARESVPSAGSSAPSQAANSQDQGAPIEPLPETEVPRPPSEAGQGPPVYLKQDGKVYLVRDWATVQRWIMERRVERYDLVSEGGVRWEPIGTRAELGSFFAAVEQIEAGEGGRPAPVAAEPEAPPPPVTPSHGLFGGPAPFPFGGSDVDGDGGAPKSRFARLDDDTEGVPMGLPPLPTEEIEVGVGSHGPDLDALPAPRSHAEVPSAAVNRPPFAEVVPSSAASDDGAEHYGDGNEIIAPPALPTPAPAPMREEQAALRSDEAPRPPPTPPVLADTPPAPPPLEALRPAAKSDAEVSLHDDPWHGFTKAESPDDPWADSPPPPKRGTPGWVYGVVGVGTLVVIAAVVVGGLFATGTLGRTAHVPPISDDEVRIGEVLAPATPPDAANPAVTTAIADPALTAPPVVDPAAVDPLNTAPPAADPAKVEPPKVDPVKVDPVKVDPPKVDPVKVDPPKVVAATDPVVPKAPSVKALVAKGWTYIDQGAYADASVQFEKALASSPNHADANYGYGYALLKQKQPTQAAPYLCKARDLAGPTSDTGREANGMITANGLQCN